MNNDLGFVPDNSSPGANDSFGFVQDQAPAQKTGGGILDKTENVLSAIAPGSKGIGESIGTLGGYLYTKMKDAVTGSHNADYYDLSSPSVLQTVGNAALMVGTGAMGGVPEGLAAKVPGLVASAPIASDLFKGSGILNAVGRVGVQSGLGLGMGAAGALSAGNTDPGEIIKNSLTGALWSGGLATAGEFGSALLNNFAQKTGESRLTEQKNNLKTLTNAFNDSSTQTTNPIKTMEENGLTKHLQVVDGKVNVEKLTNPTNTGVVDNLIQQQKDAGTEAVSLMEGGLNTDEFKDSVISSIKGNRSLMAAGKVSKTEAEVTRMFDDYKKSFGDTIDYKDINNIRVAMNKQWNPETWDAEKAVGNAARGVLYEGKGAPAALKSAMANEAELINAKEFIQKLNGTAVRGGRLGKYIADATGTVLGGLIGSPFGPVGSGIAGAVGGAVTDKAINAYQNNYFKPVIGGAAKSLSKFLASPAAKSVKGYAKSLILAPGLRQTGKP